MFKYRIKEEEKEECKPQKLPEAKDIFEWNRSIGSPISPCLSPRHDPDSFIDFPLPNEICLSEEHTPLFRQEQPAKSKRVRN